jgi:hypothetical protein
MLKVLLFLLVFHLDSEHNIFEELHFLLNLKNLNHDQNLINKLHSCTCHSAYYNKQDKNIFSQMK